MCLLGRSFNRLEITSCHALSSPGQIDITAVARCLTTNTGNSAKHKHIEISLIGLIFIRYSSTKTFGMLLVLFLLLMYGVSGIETDETEPVSVMEGDYVTLHTNLTEILHDDTILWMFGPKHALISQITRKDDLTSFSFTGGDVRFRGRLQVDENTGSLTIRNTRIKHSGQYKLSISREKTTTKIFYVTVRDMVGETDAVKSVSVTKGESATLNTDAEMHKDALMLWRFGDKGILLAKIDVETNETLLNNADQRFRDRLKLDQTGSLIITNTRTTDSGLYVLQIRGSESSQRFLLSVTGLSSGDIAGICVGVLVFVLPVAGAVIYYCLKKRQTAVTDKETVTEGESLTQNSLTEIQDTDAIEWSYEDEDKVIGRTRRRFPVGSLTVKEGDSAHLKPATEIQTDDLILWTFGEENSLVAKADSRPTDINERYRDRLELNKTTGALIIRNIRPTDSGHYNLQIINKEQTTFIRFNVMVTDSSGDRVNEPETARTPLLNGDVPDGEDEQQSSV